jgi:effector-binding domain-containing protein
MLAAAKNYRDYQQFMNKLIKFYKENEIIKEEPVTYLFAIEDMEMLKYHVYVPLVKKVFDIQD